MFGSIQDNFGMCLWPLNHIRSSIEKPYRRMCRQTGAAYYAHYLITIGCRTHGYEYDWWTRWVFCLSLMECSKQVQRETACETYYVSALCHSCRFSDKFSLFLQIETGCQHRENEQLTQKIHQRHQSTARTIFRKSMIVAQNSYSWLVRSVVSFFYFISHTL